MRLLIANTRIVFRQGRIYFVRILESASTTSIDSVEDDFAQLLPATTRAGRGKDQIITSQPDAEFLERELSVKRLNDIQDSLWVCGRPMPPRPLHHQVLLGE